MCGERTLDGRRRRVADGSAPRVRGTPAASGASSQSPVQPRVCGERAHAQCTVADSSAVQPRVCGERDACADVQRRCGRFSPACAGNADRSHASACRSPVQPRVCGERLDEPADCCSKPVQPRVCGERCATGSAWSRPAGSAPRVRGTLRCRRRYVPRWRFSPACAGNAASLALSYARVRFSPACAGNARSAIAGNQRSRFSPACAGNARATTRSAIGAGSAPRVRGTRSCRARSHRHAVQPRVCGERDMIERAAPRRRPVQPRVCGERCNAASAIRRRRFSPACAGNAALRCRTPSDTIAVQPRVCGERCNVGQLISSIAVQPRVCGERAQRWSTPVMHDRFSPACAGNAHAP